MCPFAPTFRYFEVCLGGRGEDVCSRGGSNCSSCGVQVEEKELDQAKVNKAMNNIMQNQAAEREAQRLR